MSKSYEDLDYRFVAYAREIPIKFKARTGKTLGVIDTLRTPTEHQINLANGTSWTKLSKHLPQRPTGRSLAIDYCPIEYLTMKNWNPRGSLWWELMRIVKQYPNPLPRFNSPAHLRSGGDWHDVGLPKLGVTRPSWDPGHVELYLTDPLAFFVESKVEKGIS